MTITLGHVFILVALVDLVVVWAMTRRMRGEDEALPPEKRRPASLIMAAGLVASIGLAVFALVHPIGKMPIL